MRIPRAIWLIAPLLVGAGLLLFFLRRGFGPDLPEVAPLGPLPSSTLSVAVIYGLDGLSEELEGEIPARIGGLGVRQQYPGDERLQYAFEAERGPLELSSAADTVRVSTVVGYGGQVWFATPMGVELTTSCGIEGGELAQSAPRATVQMSFPLVVDETWTVRSVPSVDRVEPVSANDRCRAAVLGFEVDATDAIMASLRAWLEEEAARVGAQVEAISPRPNAEEWWAAAQAPIELSGDVWLLLNPESLSYRIEADPDALAGNAIAGIIQAAVRPRVVVGPRPETSPRPLPALGAALAFDPDSTTAGVQVEALVGFDAAAEAVAAALEGAQWQVMGRTGSVASAELSPSGDGRLAMVLDVAGDVPARVRLVGTPVLDTVAGEVGVPDLEMTLEEGGGLSRILVGVARLFPGLMRSRARLPLGAVLPPGIDQDVDLQLADGATLEASLSDVVISEMVTTDEGVVVRARLRPEATLRVDQRVDQ